MAPTPYPGYDNINSTPFLFNGSLNRRFPAMTRIVGIRSGSDALAIPLTLLQHRRVINTTVAGGPVVVWWSPGTASALDSSSIAAGRDIGTTGAFAPALRNSQLTFEPAAGGFTDTQTRSVWNVGGQAVIGPLTGGALPPVAHVDTFWFVWAVFLPHTRVLTS